MIVEIHCIGNEFIAYDPTGKRITDRTILDRISFIDFPGLKAVYKIEVDTTNIPATMYPLGVNIDIHT